MNIYTTSLSLCLFNEKYCLIENAFNVLSHVILEVERFVGESVLMIACTIVSCTIYYMSDLVRL